MLIISKEKEENFLVSHVIFKFRVQHQKHTQEFENLLLNRRLDVNTIVNSLKDLADLIEKKIMNRFRNSVVYAKRETKNRETFFLNEQKQKALKKAINDCKTLDEAKKKFIQFYNDILLRYDPKTVATQLCNKIQAACPETYTNLGQVLQIISSVLLKQRKSRNCKEKSNTMQLILNRVPQILELPHILFSYCGYIQYSKIEKAQNLQGIPELGPLFDRYLKILQ
jgi:HD superfamily phosphohydrolase